MAQLELRPLRLQVSALNPLIIFLDAFPSLEISLLWNTLNLFFATHRGISHPQGLGAWLAEAGPGGVSGEELRAQESLCSRPGVPELLPLVLLML